MSELESIVRDLMEVINAATDHINAQEKEFADFVKLQAQLNDSAAKFISAQLEQNDATYKALDALESHLAGLEGRYEGHRHNSTAYLASRSGSVNTTPPIEDKPNE